MACGIPHFFFYQRMYGFSDSALDPRSGSVVEVNCECKSSSLVVFCDFSGKFGHLSTAFLLYFC